MRLGCCAGLAEAGVVRAAGFDFLEVPVQAVLRGEESEERWAASAPDPAALGLPMEVANSLVPATLPIVGPERDVARLAQYMQRVASRAGKLGIEVLVFGSGGARRRPEGMDEQTAVEQIVEFCRIAGDACAAHDVTLVIEHLNRSETNTINTLSEERALMEQVNHPAVAALLDTYHMGVEGEPDQAVLDLSERVMHVHVAEPAGRMQPGAADEGDGYDFEGFFSLLRKIGYSGRVSIEARWAGDIGEAGPAAVTFLRETWARTGRTE